MDTKTLSELFISRAQAVAARVTVVADEAAAERAVAEERMAAGERAVAGGRAGTGSAGSGSAGSRSVGVVRAAVGIAETGTCVVETDDEETRLETMLPETSVIVLKAKDIVRGLGDVAGYLRGRQDGGKVSYTSFITGPSRTADIERVGAVGVHGPLEVHIILVEG